MASRPDYDTLKAQAMGAGNDEAVTVNTRALIDKVLARYSGEWTTLRELLQNAADASASKVTIRFETSPSFTVPAPQDPEPSARLKHVMLNHTVKSMVVENNGDIFKDTDWARLKKIAEGNPDETKIGAFGVGFYSVFSECEEPLVSSGKQALAFYWQKDALFTRRLEIPNGQHDNTTFFLPMRDSNAPIRSLMSLCQFLASSLTFVGLEEITVTLDEWQIATLTKKTAPMRDLFLPKEVDKKTVGGLMNVTAVTKEAAQLDARWLKVVEWKPRRVNTSETGLDPAAKGAPPTQTLRGFFSRLAPGISNNAAIEKATKEEKRIQEGLEDDLLGQSTATIFIHVNKAKVKTVVSQSFNHELERATKKPPPKYTSVSLLSTSYHEKTASSSDDVTTSGPSSIFATFVPENGKGRIFIGFTTNQTTGLNVHISTPSVIPTVERESIDLNNRYVKEWNMDLLRVAGIVARISWGNEITDLSEKLSQMVRREGRKEPIAKDIQAILPEALFLHNVYSWQESTPSTQVGRLMEEAFWTCDQKSTTRIATLSSRGVMLSSQVRLAPEQLDFVDNIPTLPEPLTKAGLVRRLIDWEVITEVTMSDIKQNLEGKALTNAQLEQFLEWLCRKARSKQIDGLTIQSLLGVTIGTDEDNGKLIVLRDMKTCLNSSRIPPDMPTPPTTLPFKYTKKLSKADMELLGFDDLHLVPWLRWLLENIGGSRELSADFDITSSPAFAGSVLPVISKQWGDISQSSKATVTELLRNHSVIPTRLGMRRPEESYFPSVKLFDDLPVITGVSSVKEKFLVALGVRKTVDIGVIFERLVERPATTKTQIPASSAKWSHSDLIKYLASIHKDIPSADIDRLKSMKICPAETEALQPTSEIYLVSELFQPDQSLRRLKLRTMHWPGVYRPESAEGRFLCQLGIRAAPNYIELIRIMSNATTNQDWNLRDRAMKYFIDHHQTRDYVSFDHSTVTLPYLPVQNSEKKAATPNNCFSNEKAAILGFDVLRQDLLVHAPKFGVKPDPPMSECIRRLVNAPPESKRNAREIFSYFASRMSDINEQHVEILGDARIVPVARKANNTSTILSEKSERVAHVSPRVCFLGDNDKYADIIDYVDFGHDANTFLLRVGSKHEPSPTELVRLIIREPARIFSSLGDKKYLELLLIIAASWRTLKRDKAIVKDIRSAKCLLAYREINSKKENDNDDEEEDSSFKAWELTSAAKIVIVDDVLTWKIFKSSLLAAPLEESLEEFYYSLGASEVSSLLQETQSIGMVSRDEKLAMKLQTLILERSRLFLHDYPMESIKHNAKWIENNLKVKCVTSISIRKTLRGYDVSQTESKSAVINSEKAILYVTSGRYDMLDISQALVPVLLQRSKPQSIFMLEMILDSSLSKLRTRGYNVARLLNQKATEARIAEDARKQQLMEEQREVEREAARRDTQAKNAAESALMPGVFPDSPQAQGITARGSAVEDEPLRSKPRGFRDGLNKMFGFDRRPNSQVAGPSIDNAPNIPQEEAPPPYEKAAQKPQQSLTQTPQPEAVTAPHHLRRK